MQNNISMSSNDYNTLSDVVGDLHKYIQDKSKLDELMTKINSMSIWTAADLSVSELNYGNVLIKGNVAIAIKDNKICRFDVEKRRAYMWDIVYIIENSSTLPNGKGKCYRVFDRVRDKAVIRGYDTYSDCGDTYISLNDDQYIVLNEVGD